MARVWFDTLKMARRLEAGGFTWQQACALTEAIFEAVCETPLSAAATRPRCGCRPADGVADKQQ